MASGRLPLTRSWMLSRLANVVLPLEDGPATNTTRAPWATMRSAICAMARSCSASLTRMNVRASPRAMMSLHIESIESVSHAP